MTVLIQLTTSGADTGPFNLYSDLDSFGTPFEVGVTKLDLLAGYASVLVPDGTTTIRVCSTALYCSNCIDIEVTPYCNDCVCYTVSSTPGEGIFVNYIDCDDVEQSFEYIEVTQICARIDSVNFEMESGEAPGEAVLSGCCTNLGEAGWNCPSTTVPPALKIKWTDGYFPSGDITDPADVNQWNTWFDLPTNGNPFTSVQVISPLEVWFYGGSNIKLKEDRFDYDNLLEFFIDEIGCVVEVDFDEGFVFYDNNTIEIINLPNCTKVGRESFSNCLSLVNLYLPSCSNLGPTVGDNGVFSSIGGNNITLTIPTALMTADAGNPDGDIVDLQANNTVTIVTV